MKDIIKIAPIMAMCAVLCTLWVMAACEEEPAQPSPTHPYVCTNGTPAPGTSADRGVEECAVCDEGYHLDGHLCEANAYTCENGTAKEGRPSANAASCVMCDNGYRLEEGACVVNILYVCQNGVPVAGNAPTANVNRCDSCYAGFLLDSDLACVNDLDGDRTLNNDDVDDDNDGLIEIATLLELHNMRHNPTGTSYKASADNTGVTAGAPTAPTAHCADDADKDGLYLCGYELTQDLDFDANKNGATYTGAIPNVTLDAADTHATYFDVDAGGWLPIGDSDESSFAAIFEGNGFTIANLAVLRSTSPLGLFGAIKDGAQIRNVGVVDILLHYPAGTGITRIGGLVGVQSGGTITACYTTGVAHNGTTYTNDATIGGLVGTMAGASITASHSTVRGTGGASVGNALGGLVGNQLDGSITASYATGTFDGGAGDSDFVGGLVGLLNGSNASVVASYATGAVGGGTGASDYAGSLVGRRVSGTVTLSYGFGETDGERDGISPMPSDTTVTAATGLTAENAGSCSVATHKTRSACTGASPAGTWDAWNDQSGGSNAWIFAAGVAPKLRYADYDGDSGTAFSCDQVPDGVTCGTSGDELPGQ